MARSGTAHLVSGESIRLIVVKRAGLTGLEATRLERISPHGLRAGFVTTTYRNGVPAEEVMGHTRHRSLTVMRSYVRRSKLSKSSPAGESHDLPTKEAQTVLDGVIGLLVEHLKAGDKLRLSGLGILEVKDRPARMGRNPATGATVQIAASKKIALRAAKELKDAI